MCGNMGMTMLSGVTAWYCGNQHLPLTYWLVGSQAVVAV